MTSKNTILGISLAFVMLTGSTPLGFSDSLPSPQSQVVQGISDLDIICNTKNVLVFRITNDSPICINIENIEKMVTRNIIYPLSENPFGSSIKSSTSTEPPLELIPLTTEQEIQKYLDLSEAKIEISSIIDNNSRNSQLRSGSSAPMVESMEPRSSMADSSPSIQSEPQRFVPTSKGFASIGGFGSIDDFSTTNIQVKNVDEPDYVKNDGKHIFIANDYTITIIDATPPQDADIIEQFSVVWNDSNHYTSNGIHDIFLNDDKLIVLLKQSGFTKVIIVDISSRESATLSKHFTTSGKYESARMIDDYVYLVTSEPSQQNRGIIIPSIIYADGDLEEESIERIEKSNTFAFSSNTLPKYTYKTIISFDISGNNVNSESYLMGEGNTMYVSENSIYITYRDTASSQIIDYLDWKFVDIIFPYLEPSDQFKIRKLLLENTLTILQEEEKWLKILNVLADSMDDLDKNKLNRLQDDLKIEPINNTPRTVIQKIDIDNGKFNYADTASIAGTILNQFSMDEYENHFRIATTSLDQMGVKSNNVIVFDVKDSELQLVGLLDKIAVREDIYSARFVGDTLYLVTFRQTDPFFVIDLSNEQPKILGELKLPGFSNYLHPFGDDHVIGIGRDGGVKIALFDISDFENPKLAAQVFIGDRKTSTEAEKNHKSVLIDFEKQLLSIPITDKNNRSNFIDNDAWYGFYVYNANEKGFTPKGTVELKNDKNYNGRSLYIGDTLYSISPNMISINELDSLKEIQTIDLEPPGFVRLLSDTLIQR